MEIPDSNKNVCKHASQAGVTRWRCLQSWWRIRKCQICCYFHRINHCLPCLQTLLTSWGLKSMFANIPSMFTNTFSSLHHVCKHHFILPSASKGQFRSSSEHECKHAILCSFWWPTHPSNLLQSNRRLLSWWFCSAAHQMTWALNVAWYAQMRAAMAFQAGYE